ncbi:RNA polymerase sigma factor [Exilibacterium tricleocarpae]|uniref:RNA polymerase sigma factor n=1 Tax=Exilibacterium tricleocarpae TaxID=2591008 RepID=A0A545SPU5_9GAMM|nr:RNA polymerase sigma factor [Exilibacterium tricleocarpae]TQV66974.1 RNA polymerase sigma factor [Exilibacterium tricleocarpae]
MSDNELIARIINNNDHQAFAELMRNHQSTIRHFLRRLTAGNHALADDIAQDVFLLVFQKLGGFRGQASFSTWLHKIAYRCFLRNQQKAYYRHETEAVDSVLLTVSTQDVEADITVERLMAYLETNERVCLTLSYSVGMSHSEISNATNLPLGSVKSYISHGKRKLAEKVNASQRQSKREKIYGQNAR